MTLIPDPTQFPLGLWLSFFFNIFVEFIIGLGMERYVMIILFCVFLLTLPSSGFTMVDRELNVYHSYIILPIGLKIVDANDM